MPAWNIKKKKGENTQTSCIDEPSFSHTQKNNEINLGFLIDKKLDFFFVLLMKCGSRKKKYRNNGTTNIPNTIKFFLLRAICKPNKVRTYKVQFAK